MSLFPNPFNPLLAYINSWITSFQNSTYDGTNTETGATSVTLNTTSGHVEFTGAVNADTIVVFTLNNDQIAYSSSPHELKINPELIYEDGAGGEPVLLSYMIPSQGVVRFRVKNISSGDNTEEPIIIAFNISKRS